MILKERKRCVPTNHARFSKRPTKANQKQPHSSLFFVHSVPASISGLSPGLNQTTAASYICHAAVAGWIRMCKSNKYLCNITMCLRSTHVHIKYIYIIISRSSLIHIKIISELYKTIYAYLSQKRVSKKNKQTSNIFIFHRLGRMICYEVMQSQPLDEASTRLLTEKNSQWVWLWQFQLAFHNAIKIAVSKLLAKCLGNSHRMKRSQRCDYRMRGCGDVSSRPWLAQLWAQNAEKKYRNIGQNHSKPRAS